jgi:hypothetical protein
LTLRRILRPRDVSSSDVFIDIGCGKGRTVLQAARSGRLRCSHVEVVPGDILDYEFPDDVTVAYVYNPFTGDLFQTMVDKLLASVDRNPRPLRLIYRVPLEERRLLETGRFRQVRMGRALRPGREWSERNSIKMYASV